MKLKEQPRVDLLYKYDALIIPFEKGQNADLMDFLESLGQLDLAKDFEVKIEIKRQPRSLNANAYYHKLVRQVAIKQGISATEYHNRNLAEMSIPLLDKDEKLIWVLRRDNDSWLTEETEHFKPTDITEDRKGTMYRWFFKLKPSHLMNTLEMSKLLDNVIQDAEELGIDTRSPQEIERMKNLWGV